MRAAMPIALCAITGCDLVFGLSGRVSPDAADLDAPDAPPDIDAPEQCTMYNDSVVAHADTMLMREEDGNCNPSIRLGTYDNLNLGQVRGGERSRILLQFTLTDDMLAALQPDGGFIEATLTLSLKPVACPGPCPSTAIDFTLHAAHHDWHEGQASGNVGTAWCARKQLPNAAAMNWAMQGADGAEDRSTMPLASYSLSMPQVAGDQIVLEAMPTMAALQETRNWVVGSQLSILLIPTSPGMLYVMSREHPGGGGARLTIKSCR